MQTIKDVMTSDVSTISPQESISQAARMMDELNVGSIPVCDGKKLVGMVTDRDITVRATSQGKSPDTTKVDEVMSSEVRWCFQDQSVDEVMQEMSDMQIRRIPVVDRNSHALVGIVSLGDLAADDTEGVERTLGDISYPAEPDRPQA